VLNRRHIAVQHTSPNDLAPQIHKLPDRATDEGSNQPADPSQQEHAIAFQTPCISQLPWLCLCDNLPSRQTSRIFGHSPFFASSRALARALSHRSTLKCRVACSENPCISNPKLFVPRTVESDEITGRVAKRLRFPATYRTNLPRAHFTGESTRIFESSQSRPCTRRGRAKMRDGD